MRTLPARRLHVRRVKRVGGKSPRHALRYGQLLKDNKGHAVAHVMFVTQLKAQETKNSAIFRQ